MTQTANFTAFGKNDIRGIYGTEVTEELLTCSLLTAKFTGNETLNSLDTTTDPSAASRYGPSRYCPLLPIKC